MKRTRAEWFRRTAAILAFLPMTWLVPPMLLAQDLIFDADDEEFDSGDDLQFDPDEEEFLGDDSGVPLTTAIVLPGNGLSAEMAAVLSDAVIDELYRIDEDQSNTVQLIATPNDDLQSEFEIMGSDLALPCAVDPVCMSQIAGDVGLDEVIVGRPVGVSGGELELVLNRIVVAERQVERFRNVRADDNRDNLIRVITLQVPLLYDILPDGNNTIIGPATVSTAQVVTRWACLGLGATSLIVGVVFGLDASSKESSVADSSQDEDGVYTEFTQVEAQAVISEAEDSALLANVFIGTGVALLAVSALLFLITPGSDIDANAEDLNAWVPPIQPSISESGWGFSTGFEF